MATTYVEFVDRRLHVRGHHYSWPSALNQFVKEVYLHASQRYLMTERARLFTVIGSDEFRVVFNLSSGTWRGLKPAAIRRKVLADLAVALSDKTPDGWPARPPSYLGHDGRCAVQHDHPCDCYRAELFALLDDASDARRRFTQVQLARAVLAGDYGVAYPLVDWLIENIRKE